MSVSTPAGIPQRRNGFAEAGQRRSGPVVVIGRGSRSSREWSSSMLRISTSVPSASCQWVMSACQRSLGRSAWNRIHDDLGPFLRLRGDEPAAGQHPPDRRDRRQPSVAAGCGRGATRIVSAPASRPFLGQLLAQPDDLVLQPRGHRVRAVVRAPRPRLIAPPRPRRRTVAPVAAPSTGTPGNPGPPRSSERPSTFTAVITSRASDMGAPPPKRGANYVPRQVPTMSSNQTPSSPPV